MNPPVKRNRILALDGGGVKAVLTLAILEKMESLLRAHHGKPDLVLADHFRFVAGTSTGGILATLLSWGMSVAQIRPFYVERAPEMFTKTPFWHKARAFYDSEPLSAALRGILHDDATGQPALLGTSKLRTLLLLCMRNATTGSAWPVSNNPQARYNQEGEHGSNLQLPLWQLVRASAAAPVFFLPEAIKIGQSAFEFADGGTTPYCNPALIAVLTATLPCYRVEWPTGTDRLHLVSVGTGRVRSRLKNRSFRSYNLGANLLSMPAMLIDATSVQQDMMCRVLGRCLFGDEIDSEVGALISEGVPHPDDKQFTYARYEHVFTDEEMQRAKTTYGGDFTLDNLRIMPFFAEIGARYAEQHVRLEHLL